MTTEIDVGVVGAVVGRGDGLVVVTGPWGGSGGPNGAIDVVEGDGEAPSAPSTIIEYGDIANPLTACDALSGSGQIAIRFPLGLKIFIAYQFPV